MPTLSSLDSHTDSTVTNSIYIVDEAETSPTLQSKKQTKGDFLKGVPVDASWYGVTPSASAATNTAQLQAALDANSHVKITQSGRYTINATILLNTNQFLEMSPGVELYMDDGVEDFMIRNRDQVGGNPNIRIEGGTINPNRAGNPTTEPDWDGHSVWVQNVDNFRMRHVTFHGNLKYCFLLSTGDNCLIEDITFIDPHSDGLHFHGPCDKMIIRDIRGTCGDNMIAFLIGDTTTETTIGSFTNVLVENVYVTDQDGGIIRLAGRTGFEFNNFTIRNIKGSVTAVTLGAVEFINAGAPIFGAEFKNIVVEDVSVSGLNANTDALVYVNAVNFKDGIFRNLVQKNNSLALSVGPNSDNIESLLVDGVKNDNECTIRSISFQSGAVCDRFTLNNVDVKHTAATVGFMQVDGTINKMFGANWHYVGSGGFEVFSVNGGTIGTAMLSNIDATELEFFLNCSNGGTAELFIDHLILTDVERASYGSGDTAVAQIHVSGTYRRIGSSSDSRNSTETTAAATAVFTVSPQWHHARLDFSDFSAASTTNNVELMVLPRGGIVREVKTRHKRSFTGGAISAYTISVGKSGTPEAYASAFDVFQANSFSASQLEALAAKENENVSQSIRAFATSTGANLDAATAGIVDVWILVEVAAASDQA